MSRRTLILLHLSSQSLKECGPTPESAAPEASTSPSGCVSSRRSSKRLVRGSVQERLALKLDDLECQGISLDIPRNRALCPAGGVARVQRYWTTDLIATLGQTRSHDDHWRVGRC